MKKLIGVYIVILFSCNQPPSVFINGTVLSHNVTSDKWGDATYRTVIQCEDGNIVQRVGLKFYSIPVGNRCKLEKLDQ